MSEERDHHHWKHEITAGLIVDCTAGLARIRVRGKSLVPAPPPRISDATDLGSASDTRKLGASVDCSRAKNNRIIVFLEVKLKQINYSRRKWENSTEENEQSRELNDSI